MPTLPTLQKTWLFNVNQSVGGTGTLIGDTSSIFHKIVASLTGFAGGYWTVDYSCDGTTAGVKGDGVDRTTGNWVFSTGPTVAHTWIVLKNSVSGAELLFSGASGSGTTGSIWNFAWSPAAGFTGGSATAEPSATDQIYQLNTGAFSTTEPNTNCQHLGLTTTYVAKFHAMMSSDGTCTRFFVTYNNLDRLFFSHEKLTGNIPTSFTNPYVTVCCTVGASATVEALSYSAWFRMAQGPWTARIGATNFNVYPTCEAVAGSEIGNGQQYANDLDASFPMAPCGAFCTTGTGVRGRHGAFNDLWAGVGSNAIGTCYPGDATKKFAQFGALIFPWNGVTPLTA